MGTFEESVTKQLGAMLMQLLRLEYEKQQLSVKVAELEKAKPDGEHSA